MSVPAIKELTKKQELFLNVLIQNGGDVPSALDEAGYARASRSWLVSKLKDEIIERTRLHLASHSVRAAQKLIDGLEADGTIASSQMDTRIKAANDILDRIGISKRQEIVSESKILHGVVLLPAKKQNEATAWQDLN